MSRQNYYKLRKIRRRQAVDESLIISLVRRQRCLQPKLGCRKLMYMLNNEFAKAGISIGRDRFFGLLFRHKLLIEKKRNYRRTTNSRHGFEVYRNLLKDMVLTSSNQAYVSDITYIRTYEGFVYLSLVMDAYSRAIVGYDCSDSLEAQGTIRALSKAIRHLPDNSGNVIHHSDRGIQYCCGNYVDKLKSRGIRISMTEENHCYENSKAERLNGILKDEYGLGQCFISKSEAYSSVRQAVELYNYLRPHQALGYRCPMDVHEAA